MNSKLKYSLLFVLPVILFITAHVLKVVQGPYYLNFYDPSYVYLINSLNIAQLSGYGVGFIDHPGIPLQVFGAIVIKSFHFIDNVNQDLANDVLNRPEAYMNIINSSLIFLNSIVLLIFGFVIYKLYDNMLLTVLFQLTPFSSFNAFYELSDISAENFLLMFYILLILVSLKYINNLNKKAPDKDFFYIAAFSIITGIGIATKLNFVPLFIIPFLLIEKLSHKITYLISSFILFVFFISPGFNSIFGILTWIRRIISNDGLYSSGNSEVFRSPDFFMNLRNVFSEDIFFALVYFFILILITVYTIKSFVFRKNRLKSLADFCKNNILLIAIFLIMNLEFLFLLKKFSHHYIFPSLVLSVTALILSLQIIHKDLHYLFRNIQIQSLYLFVMILIICFQFFNFKSYFEKFILKRNESAKLNEFIRKDYPDASVISCYGSSNKNYALNYSTYWAGSQSSRYKKILDKQFPDQLFFELWTGKIFALTDLTDINNKLLSKNKIILQTNNNNSIDGVMKDITKDYGFQNSYFKKVYENLNKESVYEITVSR